MNGKDIELTRRRVLGGVATIGAASAAAGAGTFALFSDTEESTGNTVTAGTLNLELATASDGTVSAINVANAVPGQTEGYVIFSLENSGSIDGTSLSVDVNGIVDTDGTAAEFEGDGGVDPDGTGGLSEVLEVGAYLESSKPTEGLGVHQGSYATSGSHTELFTATALSNLSGPYSPASGDNVDGTLQANNAETKYLVFEYALPQSADNTVQGDSVDFDIQTSLEQ